MFFIDGFDIPHDSKSEDTVEHRLYSFDIKEEDYFLKYFFAWDCVETTFYRISLDGAEFDIPSGTYILCGCVGGSQDWITIDEMIGRPLDVFVMGKGFRGWTLTRPRLVSEGKSKCFYPIVKSPIPVSDKTGKKVIVVATTDQYHKLKDKDFDIFFI